MQQRETLQEHVYKEILSRIYEGELPDGASLPTLEELSRQYAVGENCIRAVICRLRENGYLSTRRGRPARIVFCANLPDTAQSGLPALSCDMREPYSFYEAIHILFPSVYTHASMRCTEDQLAQLKLLVPHISADADAGQDYFEVNIRFFKTVLSFVQNDLITGLVRMVMQTTVLPAALMQNRRSLLADEFLQSTAAMRHIYFAVLENDPACVKRQWQRLFQIMERTVKKVASERWFRLAKEQMEFAGLPFAGEYKYLLIAHEIYEKILEGVYPVGSFLPTIAEAQTQYRAAKVTIQTAYRVLADLEMVQTIHGRGSRVTQLVFGNAVSLNEQIFTSRKKEYVEAIELLRIVCEDIILSTRTRSFQSLKSRLESNLNPCYMYSALILCRFLMKETCSLALDMFYQVISRRLY